MRAAILFGCEERRVLATDDGFVGRGEQGGDLREVEADLQAVAAEWDLSAEVLERVLVKPKRGGVSVQLVALAWVPRR